MSPLLILAVFFIVAMATVQSYYPATVTSNEPQLLNQQPTSVVTRQNFLLEEPMKRLAACRTFDCIRSMHNELSGKTRFNLPHFFLIGFAKCATTSINSYLRMHPQMLPSVMKEPHYFSVCIDPRKGGGYENANCFSPGEDIYIKDFLRLEEATDSFLELATTDASADYAGRSWATARAVYKTFPWVKIVVVMREPISRAISYKNMHTQQRTKKACPQGASLFQCLEPFLNMESDEKHRNYSGPLKAWLTAFPKEQIHVMQFEELYMDPERVLRELKEFLGLDVNEPPMTAFKNVNNRAAEKSGWPMKKREFEHLIDLVKPDALEVVSMLEKGGHISDPKGWMKRWEEVWYRKLTEDCEPDGNCLINSN